MNRSDQPAGYRHAIFDYAMAHWQGRLSLFCSFWINLIGIRVLVFNAQNLLSPPQGQDFSGHRVAVAGAIFLVHGLLLLWQVVGLVRAAEADFATRGNLALIWAAQLGAVLMFLLSAVYALGAMQWTHLTPVEQDPLTRMAREHASRYQLSLSASGEVMRIEGSIEMGISKAVRALLQKNPQIHQVQLISPGGNVYEGRALARIFMAHGLNTRVEGVCASACTTAYIGGGLRTASPEAKLGFHQYRLDASYAIVGVEVGKEQEKDAVLFREAGVRAEFVQTLFESLPEDMWWPELAELQHARVIHKISF